MLMFLSLVRAMAGVRDYVALSSQVNSKAQLEVERLPVTSRAATGQGTHKPTYILGM